MPTLTPNFTAELLKLVEKYATERALATSDSFGTSQEAESAYKDADMALEAIRQHAKQVTPCIDEKNREIADLKARLRSAEAWPDWACWRGHVGEGVMAYFENEPTFNEAVGYYVTAGGQWGACRFPASTELTARPA